MNVTTLAWVCGGAALGVALVTAWPWMRANVAHDKFAAMIKKLLISGNADRARKLCKAAPFAPFVMATDAALAAVDAARSEPESERVRRVREAFDHTLTRELDRLSKTTWLAMVAVALGGIPVYLVVNNDAPPATLALVLIAILAIVQARRLGFKIAIAAGRYRDPLIEAMLATPKPS